MKKIYILFIFSVFVFNFHAQTFTGKPRYQVIAKRNNIVLGSFNLELWPTIAPKHTRNFDSLVSTHFYDTTAFHRVIPGFVIQGGDPNSRHGAVSTWGYGQPGQPTVDAEFSQIKHVRGVLSAARLANDTNSATSQFFICVATAANLNGAYSAYGRVTSGMVVVDTIVKQPTVGVTNRPVQKIEMFITYLGSNDSLPNKPVLVTPLDSAVGINYNVSFQLKWNAVPGALIYQMELSTDPSFTNIIKTSKQLTTIYVLNNLQQNTRYYWRVTANNGGNYSVSDTWNFHTNGQTLNLPLNNHDQNIKIYPNPSTGIFTFENLTAGSSIEILDIAGRIVLKQNSSDSKTVIDLHKKDKGNYFFQVVSGSKIVEKGTLVLQ